MTVLQDYIRAAASYWGVPVDQLNEGSTLDATTGDIEVVLRVSLTAQDIAGIAQRMARMAVEAESDARVADLQAQHAARNAPTDDQLRAEYGALGPNEKSYYGSFARYKALRTSELQEEAEARAAGLLRGGPDNTTPEPVEVPTVVWVDGPALTEQQKVMAVGRDERGRYGMDPNDLTPEQHAEFS